MRTQSYKSKEEWLLARRRRITGSRLKDIISAKENTKKKGFYELIAERIAIAPDNENPMDRGTRLEDEAITRFEKEEKKKVDRSLVIWSRDEDENIAISPDGFIGKKEAVECKCLSSASHIEAWLTKQVPSEYKFQVYQYFIVNDLLATLNVVFYDPRIPAKDYFVLKVSRKDFKKDELKDYLEYEKSTLAEVNKIVADLTF